jgi:hypothetical protein
MRHALGLAMSSFLEDYIQSKDTSLNHDSKRMCKAFMINSKQDANIRLSKTSTVIHSDNLSWHTSGVGIVSDSPQDISNTLTANQISLFDLPAYLTIPVEASVPDFADGAGSSSYLLQGSSEGDEYMRSSAHTSFKPIAAVSSTKTGLTPDNDHAQNPRQVAGCATFASTMPLPDPGSRSISSFPVRLDNSVIQRHDYPPMIANPEYNREMQTESTSFRAGSQAVHQVEPAAFPLNGSSDFQSDRARLASLADQVPAFETSQGPFSTFPAQPSAPYHLYQGPIDDSHYDC